MISLVSMLAGLGSTALGITRVLQPGAHRHQVVASASEKASPAVAAPSRSAPAQLSAQTCSNDVLGYSLRYRGPWTTSNVTPEQACAFFDTSPIPQSALLQASRNGQPPRAAIQIIPYVDARTYDKAVIDIHNRPGVDAGDTIDLGVGNTFGERIMATVTNPNGTRTRMFMYLFDLRGKPFVAAAYEPYSTNFDRTVQTLDRMMRTLHVA